MWKVTIKYEYSELHFKFKEKEKAVEFLWEATNTAVTNLEIFLRYEKGEE